MPRYKTPAIAIQLTDAISKAAKNNESVREEIQLLRVGTFHHPKHGKIEIDKIMLRQLKENFDKGARGIDIAVDYGHETEDEAAGWFKRVFLSENKAELWAEVEWTPSGAVKLSNKEYRYVSADFHPNYVDNETLEKHGPTLNGAALTNRPFIKRMEPAVELTEGGKDMPTLEEVTQERDDLKKQLKEQKDEVKKLQEGSEDKDKDAKIKKLEEQVAQLEEDLKKEKDAKEKMAEDKKMAEKSAEFDKMLSEGKVVEAQRDAYKKGDMDEFLKHAGAVNFSEKGSAGAKDTQTKRESAEDKVIELAEKKVKDDKGLDIGDAISVVLSENPDLNKEYEKEQAAQ